MLPASNQDFPPHPRVLNSSSLASGTNHQPLMGLRVSLPRRTLRSLSPSLSAFVASIGLRFTSPPALAPAARHTLTSCPAARSAASSFVTASLRSAQSSAASPPSRLCHRQPHPLRYTSAHSASGSRSLLFRCATPRAEPHPAAQPSALSAAHLTRWHR